MTTWPAPLMVRAMELIDMYFATATGLWVLVISDQLQRHRRIRAQRFAKVDPVKWCTTHRFTMDRSQSRCLKSHYDVDDHGLGEWLECKAVPLYIEER